MHLHDFFPRLVRGVRRRLISAGRRFVLFFRENFGDDKSLGCIDAVEGRRVRGWFIGKHEGVADNSFTMALDDAALGSFMAASPREDVLHTKGVLACGFTVDLAPALDKLKLDDRGEYRLLLKSPPGRVVAERRISGASLLTGRMEAPPKASKIREFVAGPALQGNLDRVDEGGLSGWAFDSDRPNTPIPLAIFVDGVEFMQTTTSFRRGDLLAKGMPGEWAGFRLAWPPGIFANDAVVDVRFARSGASLVKSPRKVAGSKPVPVYKTFLDARDTGQILPVTVVVPVFNAFEAVDDCLKALSRHLPPAANVLLMNDCSTDARMDALLESHSSREGWQLHNNERNLGYTCTVNLALSMTSGRDVVLLNSDTVVTPRWLENLRYCAYAKARVATVTALSDNAGAFSAPEIGVFNPTPEGMDPDQFARAVTAAGEGRMLEVPTGNGFCLYMRRAAIDALGFFDEQKFPRGYGEENDFCMRALRKGWKNLVTDKAYVLHKRSQSFQTSKDALMKAGSEHIHADYPEYRALTPRFSDFEFSYLRHRIRSALRRNSEDASLPAALYVISTLTGGTPQTNMDLMKALRGSYRCFLLSSDSLTLTLSCLVQGGLQTLEVVKLSTPIEPITHRSSEYDRIVSDMMYRHSIALLHVRHLGWHSLGLIDAAREMEIPVVYSIHDFYSICPSLKLLDEELKYCAGKCTAGQGLCQVELWPVTSLPPLKHRFVHRWTEMFREVIGSCDRLITTSPSARDVFLQTFPESESKLTIISHGRDFAGSGRVARVPEAADPLRILVLGNISQAKGAALLRDVVGMCADRKLEFHFLGEVWVGLLGVGTQHGKYDRENMARKIEAIGPHVGIVLSIWPETYCHTLTELWNLGIPVVGADIGAVGERIRFSNAGWLLSPQAEPAEVVRRLQEIAQDPAGFRERLEAVYQWQRSEGAENGTEKMAGAYLDVYRSVLGRKSSAIRVSLANAQSLTESPS